MLHRAILGSVERFMGTLLEHYAGALPLWLSPVQVSLIPVKDTLQEFADKVFKEMTAAGLRVEIQSAADTLGSRIRQAQTEKVPYMIVLGDKEIQAGKIAVRSRVLGDLGPMALEDFLNKIVCGDCINILFLYYLIYIFAYIFRQLIVHLTCLGGLFVVYA